MMHQKIVMPYADAAFQSALESNQVVHWQSVLRRLSNCLADKAVQEVLTNPANSEEQREAIFLDFIGDQSSSEQQNFIRQLAENSRLSLLSMIEERFNELVLEANNTIEVIISSAMELGKSESDTLIKALEKRFGKKVVLTETVDATLLGGATIKAGDELIDCSISGQLARLKSQLLN